MQPGQFLVNKDGEKRQIHFINEFIVIFEAFAGRIQIIRKSMLEKEGWSLLEEPWVPRIGEIYWAVLGNGAITKRMNYDNESDRFSLQTGNCGRTPGDAELYKQKLIERMGRKEN